ncbi:MAG: c-type cytochrome [Roseibacillus sp.]
MIHRQDFTPSLTKNSCLSLATLLALCGSTLIINGCAPLPKPAPPEPDPLRDMPNTAMATKSGISLEKLQDGWGLYMRKCGECHRKKFPQDVSDEGWTKIVPHMSWNAGLSPAEEQDLLNYLKAANLEEADSLNQLKSQEQ